MATHGSRSALDTDDAALSFGASARRRSQARQVPPVQASLPSPRAVQPTAGVQPRPDPVERRGRSLRVLLGFAAVACIPSLSAVWLLARPLDRPTLASLIPPRDDKDIVMVAPGAPPAAAGAPTTENQTASRDATTPEPPAVAPDQAAQQRPDDGAILAQLQSLRAEIDQLREEAASRRAETQDATAAPSPEAPVGRTPGGPPASAPGPGDTDPHQVPPAPTAAAPPPDAAPPRQASPPTVAARDAAIPIASGLRTLPAGALPRVQIRFARNSDVARQRANGLVEVLRRMGTVVVDARESSGEPFPRVVYFYAADKQEAARMAVLVSSGAPVRRAITDSGLLPRPGSLEVSIGNR